MRKLGTLLLPDEAQWTDQNEWSPVDQATVQTLGGETIVFSQPLTNGRPITIEIQDGITWLDQDAVDATQDMAIQAGATFSLIWDEEIFTVMFRHPDPPAVSFKPIWPNYDLFIGIIKLIRLCGAS
jgi:hypothetical protein